MDDIKVEKADDIKVENQFTFVDVADVDNSENVESDSKDPIKTDLKSATQKKSFNCYKCGKAFGYSCHLKKAH